MLNDTLKACGVQVVVRLGEDVFLTASLAYVGSGKQSSPRTSSLPVPRSQACDWATLNNDIKLVTGMDNVLI